MSDPGRYNPQTDDERAAAVAWHQDQSNALSQFERDFHADTILNRDRLHEAFGRLTPHERRLITCALAGNHPERYAELRPSVIRALAWADMHPANDRFQA